MTWTASERKDFDKLRAIDVEAEYGELVEKFASLNISDAYEIRPIVKSIVQLTNTAALQRIYERLLDLAEGPSFDHVLADECGEFRIYQGGCIELLNTFQILPFTHHWHHEALVKRLRGVALSDDRDYSKSLAILLVNLAATPAMTQEFGNGFSLFKKSGDEQLKKRAKAMYNKFAVDVLKIKGW